MIIAKKRISGIKMSGNKTKIEAIYPLSALQKALLVHHLQDGKDQGFLHVQCRLSGRLQKELLRNSWQKAVQRHAALRTSLHWEKIDKPVQLIHPAATMPWEEMDWRSFSANKQAEKLSAFKTEDEHKPLQFTRPPVSRLTLIRTGESDHLLVWTCHHILLDGWSAANIIRDVFTFYDAGVNGNTVRMEAIPPYKAYLNWLAAQDRQAIRTYWKKAFDGFREPSLIARRQQGSLHKAMQTAVLSAEDTNAFQAILRTERVTLNSYVQGAWALVLSRCTGSRDIAFGTTVSGRTTDIPNMELLAGMFMNLLPVRVRFDGGELLSDWLRDLQRQQAEAKAYEQVSLEEITSLLEWPGHKPLVDTLLVVENFPWQDIQSGGLIVKDLQGGITTTFPLTVVVIPGQKLRLVFKFDPGLVPDELITWLKDSMVSLLAGKPSPGSLLNDLYTAMDPPPVSVPAMNGREVYPETEGYVNLEDTVPRNASELQLARIWEQVLGLDRIGVNDNFFELGGTSLMAVRLFAEIEKRMGRNLPPVTLLQQPTIRSLSKSLKGDQVETGWNSLVPLRTRGSRRPIFCIHAGGGHVFFYHAMARHLDADQPVYAMQPVGMDGVRALHSSMEDIAAHYIGEMRAVQPEGPYALLGMCWSISVCHEIVRQLESAGEKIALLAIVDSAPESLQPALFPTPQQRLQGFTGRLLHRPVHAVKHMLDNRVAALKKKWIYLRKSRQERNLLRLQNALLYLYLQYTWKPHNSKVTLIRSREFAEAVNGDWFIPQWEKLAKGGVEVVDIPGHHQTLFEEPEVLGLAKALQRCLDKAG